MSLVVEDKVLFKTAAGVAGRFTKYLNHASSAQPKRATKIGSISLEGLAQFYANAPTVPCF